MAEVFILRIAICDDSTSDLEYIGIAIKNAFKNHNFVCKLKKFTRANDLLNEHHKQPFDAVFLDLDMPEINGMEAAAKINEMNSVTEIIFVTNHDELVYKSFKFRAIGFIRKKFLESEIDEIVSVLIYDINMKQQYIIFHISGSEIRFSSDEIMYMQSDDHYVDIITKNKKESVRESLNDIEKKYMQYGFIRIHSRYLVNYRYIYSIEKNTIVLNDRRQLPLSRSKVNSAKEAFQFFSRRI